MLAIDVVTIFPAMVEVPLSDGIVQRAREQGLVRLSVHDLRDFTDDRHRSVDDAPFGGGPGMVMRAEPFFRAVERILGAPPHDPRTECEERAGSGAACDGPSDPQAGRGERPGSGAANVGPSSSRPGGAAPAPPDPPRPVASGPGRRGDGTAVVLLSPRGRPFDQATAERYAGLEQLVLLCGRYEGIDERVREGLATEEVSLGDFVLTGGEVAALAVAEATVRLLPGALGDEGSAAADSFGGGLLDHPHYTRPAVVRGRGVPEVLLSGDHGRIRRWRRREALRATRERRPDLFRAAALRAEDHDLLREIDEEARPGREDETAVAQD